MQRSRKLALAILASVTMLGTAGAAIAQSDGVYNPKDQRCDEEHNDTANEDVPHDNTEPCQNATVFIENGDHEVVRAGTLHTEQGTYVHHYQLDGDFGDGFDPSKGGRTYFGADDNLSGGEHDGASNMGHGPSDGGGIQLVAFDPAYFETWMTAAQAGDTTYLFTHPFPFLNFSTGACADGICFAVTTVRNVAYQGGDEDSHRDSADYSGLKWDPEGCSGPDETSGVDEDPTSVESCDDPTTPEEESIYTWNDKVGTVYNQPGVSLYEDPNPEGSPIGGIYPIPGAYAGTCGVIISQPSGETIDGRHGGCEG